MAKPVRGPGHDRLAAKAARATSSRVRDVPGPARGATTIHLSLLRCRAYLCLIVVATQQKTASFLKHFCKFELSTASQRQVNDATTQPIKMQRLPVLAALLASAAARPEPPRAPRPNKPTALQRDQGAVREPARAAVA